jgi:hypothetical protein
VFNYDKHYNKHILQDLDDGLSVKKWGALKMVYESEFGPIDEDSLRKPITKLMREVDLEYIYRF